MSNYQEYIDKKGNLWVRVSETRIFGAVVSTETLESMWTHSYYHSCYNNYIMIQIGKDGKEKGDYVKGSHTFFHKNYGMKPTNRKRHKRNLRCSSQWFL